MDFDGIFLDFIIKNHKLYKNSIFHPFETWRKTQTKLCIFFKCCLFYTIFDFML